MEEVLFKSENKEDRAAIARYLRTIAERLEAGDPLTLESGGESVTLDPPATATFEVKAEREVEGSETELSVEFEIEWDEGDGGNDGSLSIS